MTANELREVLAEAFDGAAAGLRARRAESVKSEWSLPSQIAPEPLAGHAAEGRLALSVEEAAECLGVGRSAMYEAIKVGRVPVVRFGRRVLVPVHGLQQWLTAEAVTPNR